MGASKRMHLVAAMALWVIASASFWYNSGLRGSDASFIPVLMGGGATVAAGLAVSRNGLKERAKPTLFVLLLWWVWALWSKVGSIDVYVSSLSLTVWGAGVGVFVLASLAFSTSQLWRLFLWGLLGSAVAYCLYGFLHLGPKRDLLATFLNRDCFSVIPLLGFFYAIALAGGAQRCQNILAWFCAAFMLVSVLFTAARASFLGLFAGLLVTLLCLCLNPKVEDLGKALRALLLPLVSILAMAGMCGWVRPVLGRLSETTDGRDIQGMGMRYQVLIYGWETWKHYPLRGSGPGTFALAYQQFRPRGFLPDYLYVNVAHNDYMEMLVETGWVGFLLFGAFLGLVVRRGVRLIRYQISAWESAGLLGAMGALAGFSLFNFWIGVPGLFLSVLLTLGLIQGLPAQSTSARRSGKGRFSVLVGLALVAIGIYCTSSSYDSLQAFSRLDRAERLVSGLRWEEALHLLNSCVASHPDNPRFYFLRGKLLSRMGPLLRNEEVLKKAQADLERAAQISPRDLDIGAARLLLYRSRQQFSKAEILLEQLDGFAPYPAWHIYELTRLRLLQNKLAEAAHSLHQVATEEATAREALPSLLLEVEGRCPGKILELLSTWSQEEGVVGPSLAYAKATIRLALERRRLKVAGLLLTFVMAETPKDPETLYLWATLHQLTGRLDERKKALLELATLHQGGDYVDSAWIELAEMKGALRPLTPQFAALESRLLHFPDSAPLRLSISQVYLTLDRTEVATEVVARGLDLRPKDPDLLARMGTCLQHQGMRESATEYFQQAVSLDPRNQEARMGLASPGK